jgi:hypothetical protein
MSLPRYVSSIHKLPDQTSTTPLLRAHRNVLIGTTKASTANWQCALIHLLPWQLQIGLVKKTVHHVITTHVTGRVAEGLQEWKMATLRRSMIFHAFRFNMVPTTIAI